MIIESETGISSTKIIRTDIVDTIEPTPGLATPATRLVAAGRTVPFNASNSTDNIHVTEYRWDFDTDGTVD